MTIGERIKLRREELGITQEELAQMLGYKSRSSINKIELGGNELTQRKIKAIALALKTTPAYIMGWTDEWEEKYNKDGILSEGVHLQELIEKHYGTRTLELVNEFQKLDEIDQGKIIERVDILLEDEKYSFKKGSLNA